ncbi:hypothetical protein ACIPO9_09810 [Pseudomonas sp. NPDC090203]|uniref:hypothetical protein n=1 Tax=Pseudomonas sp. NPDC090203 TaxID=3364477 RepID=UPI003822A23E
MAMLAIIGLAMYAVSTLSAVLLFWVFFRLARFAVSRSERVRLRFLRAQPWIALVTFVLTIYATVHHYDGSELSYIPAFFAGLFISISILNI